MLAFSAALPVAHAAPALGASLFVTPLAAPAAAPVHAAPTMGLRVSLRRAPSVRTAKFGPVADILAKADDYMAKSVLYQYYNMSNPSGVYGVQCTEGATKGAAFGAAVRVKNNNFRALQRSPGKKFGDMYEFRKQAIHADHLCNVEAKQFSSYSKMAETYVRARAEAYGTCDRYATPESVEEAAMARYMDAQQKIAVNGSGVYSSSCVDGASKGAAEELRVATLNAAFRNGQKPAGQILREKYNQRRHGFNASHGCNYEEGLVSKYPAIGASFRSKAYGY